MSKVIGDLAHWGPDATPLLASPLSDAQAYCRRLARTHYENFPVASVLLPRELRQHFANVYTYCRWADDLGDETADPERSLDLLAWWREELRRCFDGAATHPVFVALRETIEQCGVPQQPFEDLILAFEQDQQVTRYDSFNQLHDYCRRSANPVGRIVLHLCRNVTEETLAWSDSICTGLQLANFWQDVSRDFDKGRVYLPKEDRERFGYTDRDLDARLTNDGFLQLMRFQVGRARTFLHSGLPLVGTMRGRMQVNLEMFVRGGLQVLTEIERIGCRVWERRPIVGKLSRAKMLCGCISRAFVRRGGFLRPGPTAARSALPRG